MKISSAETKVMAFRDKEPVITKLIINYQPIVQVSHFNYSRNYIGYDIVIGLGKFQRIRETIDAFSETRYVEKQI